ncbi:MAG: beta-lactamase family protein [Oscillospiraceae bacterium]|nr:beta-lactamase family protein [Oscillospiraceae bacterium]
MNNRILDGFIAGVREKGLGVHEVVVRHNGEVVAGHQFIEPQGRVQLFSASKSWTAIAVGIAIGEGLFGIKDRMVDLLDGDIPFQLPDGFDRLTVWHLLTMSTGHSECPVFKMQARERERLLSSGAAPQAPGSGRNFSDKWFEAFMTEPLSFDPDSGHWAYNNGATYVLARIVEKATGMNMRDYLMPRIFDPLEIADPVWDCDPQGHALGAIGLHLTTEELSRGGQLLLNMGRWNGKQLVPEEYVRQMTSKQVENANENTDENAGAGYGYQTWMCARPGAYRMDGMFSQLSIGVPDCDAVIALTSHEEKNGPEIIRLVFSEIVPELQ